MLNTKASGSGACAGWLLAGSLEVKGMTQHVTARGSEGSGNKHVVCNFICVRWLCQYPVAGVPARDTSPAWGLPVSHRDRSEIPRVHLSPQTLAFGALYPGFR